MASQRYTKVLFALVLILLVANLFAPLMKPGSAYAEEEKGEPQAAISGSGTSAWIVKGNMVYYLKFEQKFESIRIVGPEELEE